MKTEKEINVQVVHKGTTTVEAPAIPDFQIPLVVKTEAGAIEKEENIYRIPARGGNGGKPFEFKVWDKTNKQYHRIQKLEVWIELGKAMRAVQVTFDNGFQQHAGTIEERQCAIDLHVEEKEMITTTVLYDSQWKGSGRTNGIDMRTDWGQQFYHLAGQSLLRAPKPYTDDTRGVLIGVYGGAGVDIDRLGLILELPEDEEYMFEDVNYDLSECKIVGEKPVSLKEETVENPTDATMMQQISFSHTHSDTKTWGHTVGLKMGVKTSFSTGVPCIAEGKVEVSFEANYSYNWGGNVSDIKTDQWVATLIAPPHSHLRAVGTVTEASINVPFTARLRKRKSDGTEEIVNQVSGVYEGVNVSKFRVKVEDLNI
jgi:hypothetical protein